MKKIDTSSLTLIGQGSHGKVYRLDESRCIKVCTNKKNIQMEYRVLKHCEGFPQFPRVYECEGNYMIREYVDGQNIADYIIEHGLDRELARKLVELIDVFKQLGFTRLDCRFSQIFITNEKQLKVIDTTRHMDKHADYPYKLLKALRRLGYKDQFMAYVKELRPGYYQTWQEKDHDI